MRYFEIKIQAINGFFKTLPIELKTDLKDENNNIISKYASISQIKIITQKKEIIIDGLDFCFILKGKINNKKKKK
jgi:hypothetical protein